MMVSEEPNSKKQENEDCFINRLLVDLIEQIFLTLPVSALLSCVGVCKKWKNFIRDPLFVTLHLKHASRFSLLFFGQESVGSKRYPSDAILIDETWSQSTYAVPTIGPDDILCGSINGLLCLYTKISTIKIANIATGERMCLQKPIKNLSGDHFSFYTFGFHPVKKEYKVTHFLNDHLKDPTQTKYKCNVIQVYTLGDEKWKNFRAPEAFNLNIARNSGAINVDGTLYWLTEDMKARWKHAIMSFDLGEESFEILQLPSSVPEDCASGGPRKYWVKEIDGKMCITTAQTCRDHPREIFGKLQIWTLENKLEKRWSQKYNIHLFGYTLGPNLSHGDKLLMQFSGKYMFSYELVRKEENPNAKLFMKEDIFYFGPRKPYNIQSYMCVKSLVRLDVYKKAGIVRRPKKGEGWELKNWEAWEHKIYEMEEQWNHIHREEHEINESSERFSIELKNRLAIILDDVIRQQIGMQVDHLFPGIPDQQPRSLCRLNMVGLKQDQENLVARTKKLADIKEAMAEAIRSILSIIKSAVHHQVGALSSDATLCSQYHNDGKDTIGT